MPTEEETIAALQAEKAALELVHADKLARAAKLAQRTAAKEQELLDLQDLYGSEDLTPLTDNTALWTEYNGLLASIAQKNIDIAVAKANKEHREVRIRYYEEEQPGLYS